MSNSKTISRTAKYMLFGLLSLFIAFLVIGEVVINYLIAFEPARNYAIGLSSGILISVVKVLLLDWSVNKAVDADDTKAKSFSKVHIIARYVLTIGYAVVVIVLNKWIGVWGAVIGLISMQIAAYYASYKLKKDSAMAVSRSEHK